VSHENTGGTRIFVNKRRRIKKRFLGILLLPLAAGLQSAPHAAAADLGSELHWQPAAAAAVVPEPSLAVPGDSLEAIAAAIRNPQPEAARKTPPPVVEAEMFPVPYRPILRRYFDTMRP